MKYKIDVDGKALYRNVDELNLLNPQLNLEDNNSGSLTFKMPSNHPRYDDIKLMKSEVIVYRDDKEIWRGRPILVTEDFYKNKSVECEGELAYLNDVIQPQKEYKNYTPDRFLRALITEYNKRCDKDRWFHVGEVTVIDKNDSILRYTNWDNTLECINDKLIKQFGGHLRIRHVGNIRYLDYLQGWTGINSQTIRFGVNIVDFSTNYDVTDIATAIIPLGARQEKKTIEALEEYLTIKSVNSGSVYLSNTNAVKEFGWIEKVIKWDDVTLPSNLKAKGEKYLTDYQFDTMQLELTAVDLANMDVNYEGIELLQEVQVKSTPHGLDKLFPVTKMQLSLDNSANDKLTLGVEQSKSLTAKNSEATSEINKRLDVTATISSVKQTAVDTATELIKSGVDGGHVVTSSNEILIMDNEDKTKAKNVWRFNQNGIGYSKTGYNGTYGTAITMDGQIVADYITAGTLSADRIKGGTLTLGGSGYNINGQMTVLDKNNKVIGNINRDGAYFVNCKIGNWAVYGGDWLGYEFNNKSYVRLGGKQYIIDNNKEVLRDSAISGYYWGITTIGEATLKRLYVRGKITCETIEYATLNGAVGEDCYIYFKRPYGQTGSYADNFTGAVNTLIADYLRAHK